MAKQRYYLAYGSNLNVPQMNMRCPNATIVGTAKIEDYELLFKGSMTEAYLTIEKCIGSSVPGAVWSVTESDEYLLDRYEGYPSFYYKKEMNVKCKGIRTGKIKTINAFVYIMHDDRQIALPSNWYMKTCLEGYDTFYFDRNILLGAYEKCKEIIENER